MKWTKIKTNNAQCKKIGECTDITLSYELVYPSTTQVHLPSHRGVEDKTTFLIPKMTCKTVNSL
jgi:hypothetical protein